MADGGWRMADDFGSSHVALECWDCPWSSLIGGPRAGLVLCFAVGISWFDPSGLGSEWALEGDWRRDRRSRPR